jgi:hypothetical protein
LNVVTSTQWQSDVQTLKDLGFKNITYSPNWVNMVRMIGAERADITLAPFQTTSDMSITVDDVTLYPVRGVTVSIAGSRHWLVSRKHSLATFFTKRWNEVWHNLRLKKLSNRLIVIADFFTLKSRSGLY